MFNIWGNVSWWEERRGQMKVSFWAAICALDCLSAAAADWQTCSRQSLGGLVRYVGNVVRTRLRACIPARDVGGLERQRVGLVWRVYVLHLGLFRPHKS